ncbi:proline-rich protein 23A3-like [Mesocricetus auratus]|uniref:Proline-rich protein 23A3-like n=1 Tax=Mesocricetus auratus TaxID=10036 RepID=A0ABM2X0L2_MESAU|nr:proline-rich protein 23A3-like [Mesocricetus auratus]
MLHMRPHSPSADPAPCWAPQPQGPSPAKRRRLHEPARHEPPASPDLEAPTQATNEELTSVLVLAHGCAMQLQLDGVDLLLEPEPTSVMQVELPGHTLILVPEGLQSFAHLGQPGFLSTSPQEGALRHLPQDHLVVLQQGSLCEDILDNSYQEVACDEEDDSGFLSPWIDAPAGQASELLSCHIRMPTPWPQDYILEPQLQVPSPTAEPWSPRSFWDLDSYLQGPFPTSPLQPLPPSPPPSPQEQRPPRPPGPPRPPRAPCKARRRLFYE